jgi:hypothetical protein
VRAIVLAVRAIVLAVRINVGRVLEVSIDLSGSTTPGRSTLLGNIMAVLVLGGKHLQLTGNIPRR